MQSIFTKAVYLFFLAFVIVVIVTCSNDHSSKGALLASSYCGSCHQVPDPNDLPKEIWKEILPTMEAKMGLYLSPGAMEHRQLLSANDMLLSSPMLSPEEWIKIQQYYLENSPDTLPHRSTVIQNEPLTLFEARPLVIGESIPAASMVAFGQEPKTIYYGDAARRRLFKYDLSNDSYLVYDLDGAPSGILQDSSGIKVLTMGNIHPNDLNQGKVISYTSDSVSVDLSSLSRPVHISRGDLNNDGLEDLVVSGFGYLKGDLSWYENMDTSFFKHPLRLLPGALGTVITDLNKDGHPDIIALMGQGDEGFFFYQGDGKGKFSEQRLISFPSSYGSSYFELRDMNNDGYEDIIYANGDNGDYSRPVLKPYHGIRIFLNQRTSTPSFKEVFFYPMNGPFKAMVEDYNLDGHMDIACISYFPDYEHTPNESFLMLMNQGSANFNYRAFSIPQSTDGKWLTADRGDFDDDGDIDILLGNGPIMSLHVPDVYKQQWRSTPVSVLLLENKTKSE